MNPSAPRLGAQVFINRTDTPGQVAAHFATLAASGLRLARLFVFWDHVNPSRDTWIWHNYDAAFDAAARHGIGVVPTLFAQCPPGWLRLTQGNQSVGPLENPALRAASLDYVRRTVSRWAAHPALDSWITWNEASLTLPRDNSTLPLFQAWLRTRYADDISRYNRQYYRQFASFAEIDFEPLNQLSPIPSRTETADWIDFSADYLVAKLRELNDAIRALDAHHPVHLNPHNLLEAKTLRAGQSIWREAAAFDFLGCSLHPVWHCTRYPAQRRLDAVALTNDLMRAATPGPEQHYWVSELQGGPALLSGVEPGTPTPLDLHAWLWDSLGAGARAIVFWSLNVRTDGGEGGEWALLDCLGRPSRRLQAASRVAASINRHAALLGPARPPSTPIKILHSEATWRLGLLEGSDETPNLPRNREAAADALGAAHALLAPLGHEIGFLDEPAVLRRAWFADTRLLVLPGCYVLEEGTLAVLRDFVAQGGIVVADDLCGWKDPAAWVRLGPAAEPHAALFGADLADYEAHSAPLSISPESSAPLVGWLVRADLEPRPDTGTTVLARWPDGPAAITAHEHPSGGCALRLGTRFFQPAFTDPVAAKNNGTWLRTWLRSRLPAASFTLAGAPPGIRLRQLTHPEGTLLVVYDPSARASTFTLSAPMPGLWRLSSSLPPFATGQSCHVELSPQEPALVLFTPLNP